LSLTQERNSSFPFKEGGGMREEPIHPLPKTRRGPSTQAEMPELDPELQNRNSQSLSFSLRAVSGKSGRWSTLAESFLARIGLVSIIYFSYVISTKLGHLVTGEQAGKKCCTCQKMRKATKKPTEYLGSKAITLVHKLVIEFT